MPRKYVGAGVWVDEEVEKSGIDVAFEDVATRFLTHLPTSELESGDRLFFQIEQAHWFYEDFLADAPGAKLPHMNLRVFAQNLFARCALLKPLKGYYETLFSNFRAYKGKIPVCGCVLLDATMSQVVLVRNWAKTSWGLPKGKLNQSETKVSCAARECLEETGFDVGELDEQQAIEIINNNQRATMYVVAGVPLDYPFSPRVRKEISEIAFFPLDKLPAGQWNVDKFVPRIKRMVKTSAKNLFYQKPPSTATSFGPDLEFNVAAIDAAIDAAIASHSTPIKCHKRGWDGDASVVGTCETKERDDDDDDDEPPRGAALPVFYFGRR
ncbi:hypothetical protein CTAYLR_009617 [Chrysophaeum taylorii]|uniref:Nudix hydrolase domain-containing protein n=1 Tax=Chrysophaeum taylorii TaxID=2483200 RepID=A0AAD7XP63_9STRA|nr:hypothetical protein CTAYLR_009617 [Chrysophaeum taylorii]